MGHDSWKYFRTKFLRAKQTIRILMYTLRSLKCAPSATTQISPYLSFHHYTFYKKKIAKPKQRLSRHLFKLQGWAFTVLQTRIYCCFWCRQHAKQIFAFREELTCRLGLFSCPPKELGHTIKGITQTVANWFSFRGISRDGLGIFLEWLIVICYQKDCRNFIDWTQDSRENKEKITRRVLKTFSCRAPSK